jgi:hypothetical protein
MTNSTTNDAQRLLDAASHAESSGAAIARRSGRGIGIMSIAIGVLVAYFLIAVVYIFPTENLALIIGSVVIYTIGICASVFTYNHLRVASGTGATNRYMVGLSFTMGLFCIGVALSFIIDVTTPLLWAPFSLAVAAPLIATGIREARR